MGGEWLGKRKMDPLLDRRGEEIGLICALVLAAALVLGALSS